MGTEQGSDDRRRGRPRNPGAGTAILQATIELFADEGPQGLSVERVATAAGVSRSTIYRRWNSKDEMVADALAAMAGGPGRGGRLGTGPDTGALRSDLRGFLSDVVGELRSTTGRVYPRLLAEVASGSALGTVFMRRLLEPRRAALIELLRRAVDRGEVRSGVDLEAACDLVLGAPMWISLTRRLGAVDGEAIDALVELCCQGLLSASPDP